MPCLSRPLPMLRLYHQRAVRHGGAIIALLALASFSAGTPISAQTQPSRSPDPATAPAAATPTVSGGRIVRPTLRLGSQGESVRELQSMLVLLGYYPGPVSGVYQEDTQLAVQQFQRAAAITADGIVGPATWSQLLPAPTAETTPPSQASTPAATTPTASEPSSAPGSIPTAQTTPPTSSTSSPTSPSTPNPSTPNTSTSVPNTLPILRPGMEGDAVRQLQQRLRAKGVYNGTIDGIFGSQTEAAVRSIQQSNNLTVDGIVGPATWRVLD